MIIRILIIALFIYIAYLIFNKLFGKASLTDRKRRGDVIDEMVQDPFCKIYIPRHEAKRKVIKGTEYYFCSWECADKFLEQLKRNN